VAVAGQSSALLSVGWLVSVHWRSLGLVLWLRRDLSLPPSQAQAVAQ
jgi:hypothetical protein